MKRKTEKKDVGGNTPPDAKRDIWLVAGVCIFLVLAVFAVFGQTVRFNFVNFDDNANVYLNQEVARGLTWKGCVWALTHRQVGNWIPLTTLSHMLDCQLFGMNAGGHHLTNVLIHAADAVLLFLLLRNITGALWRSAFVAAVFAIHPLRAESVAWVSERKDVLSALFFFLTLGAYARYARRPPSVGRYGVVIFLFALGLMSKPMLVTLPFVLLLLDYWPLRRWDSLPVLRLVLEKIPLLALSIGVCAATVAANRNAIVPIEKLSLLLRIDNALVSYVRYMGQMAYPVDLAAFYPHPKEGLPFGEIVFAALILAAVSTGVFVFGRRRPYLVVGWLWYLGMLVPVIGIVQAGALAGADRYTYLPQIGLWLLVAWMLTDLCRRQVALAIMVAVLPVFMACARTQTSYWRNSETLWNRTIACTRDNALAHHLLGTALYGKGRVEDAIAEYHTALRIRPNSPEAHASLGSVLLGKGQLDEAIVHFRKALETEPDYMEAITGLGVVFSQKGQVDEAIVQYQKVLEIQPEHAGVRTNYGLALLKKGEVKEAITQYQMAIAVDPQFILAQNNLAWVLATCSDATLRHGSRAVDLAEQAVRLSGGAHPEYLDTLAAAYAEAGRFPEAVKTAQQALELAQSQANASLINALQAEIKLYWAGKPFRDNDQALVSGP